MAFILPIEEPWTSQPQGLVGIDWSNPAASKAVYCVNYATRNLVDQAQAQGVGSVAGTLSYGAVSGGVGLLLNGSSSYTISRKSGYIATTSSPHTLISVFVPSSIGAVQGLMCFGEVTDSNWASGLYINAAGKLAWYAGYSAMGSDPVSAQTLEVGKIYVGAVVVRAANDRSIYVNGERTNSAYSQNTACSGGAVVGDLALNGALRGYKFNGVILANFAVARALRDDELLNPWQIFAP